MNQKPKSTGAENETSALRRGWTTGACATAATKSALHALLTGSFLDPVTITLPKGEQPAFALCREDLNAVSATIIKDAGDDPDVTHGAAITATITRNNKGTGITFHAGDGVGTITKPGLPLPVGEPAINPIPRKMMAQEVNTLCAIHNCPPDFAITISIDNGQNLATKTWNPRLGILGGLSVLGTTGIVVPFSCSAWIHSIHRGIDVARATGITHIAGATGSTSESAVQKAYDLDDYALIDMGDFVGGMLKYLREHPVERVTIAGGFAKICKLAQGAMDLHSGRSQVDFDWLANQAKQAGAAPHLQSQIISANTAKQAREIALASNIDLAAIVAEEAKVQAQKTLRDAPIDLDIFVIDREGNEIARR